MSERPDLNELRGKLDEIDNSILDLLEERMAAEEAKKNEISNL